VAPDARETAWEPGAPSLRAMAPSTIFGAIIPLAVYYAVRPHVGGDAPALMIAGAIPAAWVVVEWVRKRTLDAIGSITLFGFIAGIIASVALGNNAFVLKVRDSAFTALFGLVCLASLRLHKPLMFHLGKALSAGDDEEKRAAYDELFDMPTARRTFLIITAVWGVGLILEACARVLLAVALPTGPFLAVSPVLGGICFGGLFVFTLWYSKVARARGEALLADTGVTFPAVGAQPVLSSEASAPASTA
jgi:FtsH-binding integral membrane protein